MSKWNNMRSNLEWKHITQKGKYDLEKVDLKDILNEKIVDEYVKELSEETKKLEKQDPEFYGICNKLLKNWKKLGKTFEELIDGEREKYKAMIKIFKSTKN